MQRWSVERGPTIDVGPGSALAGAPAQRPTSVARADRERQCANAAAAFEDPGHECRPTAPVAESDATDPIARDFEHERVRSVARRALFGIDSGCTHTIGRYRIDRKIGAGGMGEVYQGADQQLGRCVAIKLVLPNLGRSRGQRRLRREAQALARLSHPNVVQVYEVGEHDGRTFLAMEYVEGGTLTHWLRKEPRGWAAIVARFVAAGRGLAAAHAADIIHRDFKPDNVLLTRDGRCRVADFGLASTYAPRVGAADGEVLADSASDSVGSAQRLSTAGSVLGTVRYMPLEQLRGESVDARADQFAFCVALYEALWQRPPFAIANMVERLEALETHAVIRPPRGGVPRSVWRVLRRGLAREPEQRWPDLGQLLRALESIPRRRRRVGIGAIVVPAAALLVGLGRASEPAGDAVDPCAVSAEALEGSWDADRSEALGRAFVATNAPFASASAAATRRGLDGWSRAWLDQRQRLCEATVGEQLPGEVLGLRGACLERQRVRFEATVQVLIDADAEAVAHALEPVAELPRPDDCRDDERLLLGLPLPPPAKADAVARLRRTLARSQAERLAGHPGVAQGLVTTAVETAEALGYPPALAEALAEVGEVEVDLGRGEPGVALLERAVDLAEASLHDRLAARVWPDLVWQTASVERDHTRASDQLRRARAANARIGADPLSRSRLEFLRAQVAVLADDRAQAESALRNALAIIDEEQHPGVAVVRPGYLGHLAKVVADDGRIDEAVTLRRNALQAAEDGLGPQHPEAAVQAFSLGQILHSADRAAEAVPYLERAAAIWMEGPSTPDPELGTALLSLTQLALGRGEAERAERHAHQARAVFARGLPSVHPRHGDVQMALGVIAESRGRPQVAVQAYALAVQHYEQSLGPNAPILVQVQLNTGFALLQLDRFEQARLQFEAALAATAGRGTGSSARLCLAVIALRQGDPDGARDHLDAMASGVAELDAEDRTQLEFLDGITRIREGRGARHMTPAVRTAFGDPSTPLHEALRWLARLGAMTPSEGRRLGIDLPPNP